MKETTTYIKLLGILAFLLVLPSSLFAQSWVDDSDQLYYLSEQGPVYFTADYSALAIYFESAPPKDVESRFTSMARAQLTTEKVESMQLTSMELRSMLTVKNSDELFVNGQNKTNFLSQLNMEDAYDVLPAFNVDGIQAWLTDRIIIKLAPGVSYADIAELLLEYEANFVRNITDDATFLLEVTDHQSQLELIHVLAQENAIDWGEPDFKMEIQKRVDPNYSEQWFLNNTGGSIDGKALVNDLDIDAPEAWAISTGSSSVTVAVIDDGVEGHEDMATLLTGYTPANSGDGTPYASNDGHGQACAGIVAALHNEIGVRGVAPGVSVFSVNIFHPSTTNADLATAINWAVNNGADVLSNSWGFNSCTASISSLNSAFSNAATNGRGGLGCIILVASGNDFGSCVGYPANLSTVMAVGGISGDGVRSMFSNYGPTLDIVAPSDDDWVFQGGQWYSTGTHGLRTIDRMGSNGWASGSSNYYDSFGGTSGATPQVAGVAALVLSVNPALTKSEVDNILTSSADDVGPAGFDNEYGHGRLNAHAALLAAGPVSCDATVPANLMAANVESASADMSWDMVAGANYDLRYRESGTSSWTIANVTSNSYTITGLDPLTAYEAQVRSNCDGGSSSAYSSSTNFSTLDVQLNYCNSASTNVNDEYIGNVNIGSINNTSGAQFYSDFTALSTVLTKGDNVTITVTPEWTGTIYNEGYSVWIDYNNDGDFSDAGEQVWTQSATTATPVSGNFTIPASAAETSTRMRVSMKYNGIPSACETFTYGEVEDYTVIIEAAGADEQAPSVPNGLAASSITETSMLISWNASTDNVGVTDYDVYQDGNLAANVSTTSYNATGLTENTGYAFYVIARDAAGNSSAASATLNASTLAAPTCDDGIQNGDETGVDCGGSCAPCQTGSVVIHEGFFESGWDGWSDGGSDCARYGGSRSYEGNYSIRIRDNSGTASSMTSPVFDLSSYDQVEVEFYFYSFSMENNEDFWLRYYNGSGWSTVATWARGSQFENNNYYTSTVTLDASNYNLVSNGQFRFQCDASGNQDHIYIDAVTIRGITGSGLNAPGPSVAFNGSLADGDFEFEDDYLIYPNPVTGNRIWVKMAEEKAVQIRIISVMGQEVYRGNNIQNIDISGLESGVYLMELDDGEEAMTKRFVKH